MRWGGRGLRVAALGGAFAVLCGCARLFIHKGFPQYDGKIGGLPLESPVEVLRDVHGIPHIFASHMDDLLVAQGFVHAQDRLWQMEVLRRMAAGRLSEVAGREALEVDYFIRLIGVPELARRALENLRPEQRRWLDAYARGVNAFLQRRGRDLPLEFRVLGVKPEPWTALDCLAPLVLNAWFLATNYRQELFTLMTARRLGREALDDLFPSHPGARLPEDAYFEDLRRLRLGRPVPGALSLLRASPVLAQGSGSNNWAVRRGKNGLPMLANDPHLALTVPGIWYFCHLEGPGIHLAGASIPGAPGIVIGHNGRVAWGFTNVMIDAVDLYVFRVDPREPTRYRWGAETLEMEREEVTLGLPHGDSEHRVIYRTIHGPVVTEVKEGVEAVASLKWYGTYKGSGFADRSFGGYLELYRARDVFEALEAGRHFGVLGQNLLAADVDGNIGWHVTGAVPRRRGYSGRLPADGSGGEMDWDGFLPYQDLPHRVNPPEGWLATANQHIGSGTPGGPALSFAWCAPYRYLRIAQLLKGLDTPSLKAFRKIQMDVHSLQADMILPKVLAFKYRDERARRAASMLRGWDREVRADSAAAALYEVFLTQWVRLLLEDDLGEDFSIYYHLFPAAYLVQDVLLDRPDSPLWDRRDTPQREGPGQILEEALGRAWDWLEENLGGDPSGWRWGDLHGMLFQHPGGRIWLLGRFLNRGPFPADGDNTTVNAAGFVPAEGGFGVLIIPSLRMRIALGDLDAMEMAGPMGQSGQPGHPHYDDLIGPWMRGEGIRIPLRRQAVEPVVRDRLVLSP